MTERQAASLRLVLAATRVTDAIARHDPVATADARTSACDARAALCLAIGHTVDEINPARGNLKAGVRFMECAA